MAKVIFKLSQSRSDGEMAELSVRFYHGRALDVQVRTGILVPVSMWSDSEQRLSVSRRYASALTPAALEAQVKIDELRSFLLSEWLEASSSGVAVDRQWVERMVARFNGCAPESDSVLLSDVVPEYVKAHGLSAGTARQYKVLQGMIERFGDAVRPLYIDKVSVSDIDDFARFLRMEHSGGDGVACRSQNTVNSKLRRVSAIMKWLVQCERISSNPFDRYRISEDVYGTPFFLTLEERDALYAFPFAEECDRVQRDIFVFQCHVGCRVSDLMSFTPANVGEDGVLQYIQHKLRRSNASVVRVPLSSVALEIISRYKGKAEGRLLPCISDVKYNVAIKRILSAAGLCRPVLVQDGRTGEPVSVPICDAASSHLARRTFMANMYKKVRSERIVSAFTGHASGSAAFKRYTEVDDEMKIDIIREMEGDSE